MEKKVSIINESGLHIRPASNFVKVASKYKSNIEIIYGNSKINGKSIMGIMSLGVTKGNEIIISAKGEDEEKALNELVELVENGFGE
ncbi:HPr family phosphocarrier protein [Clostridium oryzae]|uniref:Phosphocarrier protein HPr n=1 Tax=Clostridium oryzae TaxID=1450648 RepID=A0A1V4IDP2_9CLOT|nr:HPr family phosphocarrier protein [Clostridium oryzae]OPJ57984.1 phosphocarrier protein HPr [Clostridium oryzae]